MQPTTNFFYGENFQNYGIAAVLDSVIAWLQV